MPDQQETSPPALLRQAARVLRILAADAPQGPYTHVDGEDGYNQLLLAADGDPFASTRDWSSGIGTDTGMAEQNAAHLRLWTPAVALALADWLDTTADGWPTQVVFTTTQAQSRVRKAAMQTAQAILTRQGE